MAGEETVAEEKPAKPADGQVEETGQKQDSDEKKEDKKKENRPKIGTKKVRSPVAEVRSRVLVTLSFVRRNSNGDSFREKGKNG